MALPYAKAEILDLVSHPDLNERWVQDRIAADPTILGLGNLILKDKERPQPRAGRLDLLFQDVDTNRRYEVELQLGATDESHIIRTIEYWDIERKMYPQYDHCAVIIAEDITSRFLNVIGLFNGSIPLIAIQVKAVRVENSVTLIFTTVLDELTRGLVDEDEEIQSVADRHYWEEIGSKAVLASVDDVVANINTFASGVELKYNKFYIGLAKEGRANNFVVFRPKKNVFSLEPRLKPSDEIQKKLQDAGIDIMAYDKQWGRYRLRLGDDDFNKHKTLIMELLKLAWENSRQ